MSETTEQVAEILRGRLQEIEAEAGRLERALKSLGGRSDRTQPAASKSSGSAGGGIGSKRPRRAKRAAPGERQAQLLAAIREQPAAGPSALAEAIGVKPPQVHALLAKLRAERLISKQGKGYSVKARAADSTTAKSKSTA